MMFREGPGFQVTHKVYSTSSAAVPRTHGMGMPISEPRFHRVVDVVGTRKTVVRLVVYLHGYDQCVTG